MFAVETGRVEAGAVDFNALPTCDADVADVFLGEIPTVEVAVKFEPDESVLLKRQGLRERLKRNRRVETAVFETRVGQIGAVEIRVLQKAAV